MSESKTPEQIAAEAAAAAANKAAAKAAKDAEKAAAKAAAMAAKEAKAATKAAAAAAVQAAKDAKLAEKAEKAAEKEAAKAARKNTQPEQNGVRRPKPDTKCGQAWAICDQVSASLGQPAPIANVLEAAKALNLNEGNVRCEYVRWKKFFGVSGRVAKPATAAAA